VRVKGHLINPQCETKVNLSGVKLKHKKPSCRRTTREARRSGVPELVVRGLEAGDQGKSASKTGRSAQETGADSRMTSKCKTQFRVEVEVQVAGARRSDVPEPISGRGSGR